MQYFQPKILFFCEFLLLAFLISKTCSFMIETSKIPQSPLFSEVPSLQLLDKKIKGQCHQSLFQDIPVIVQVTSSWDNNIKDSSVNLASNIKSAEISTEIFNRIRSLTVVQTITNNSSVSQQSVSESKSGSDSTNNAQIKSAGNGTNYNSSQTLVENPNNAALNQTKSQFVVNLFPNLDYSRFLIDLPPPNNDNLQNTPDSSNQREDFPEVTLNHEVPDEFLEGQIFLFSGRINAKEMQDYLDSKVVTIMFLDESLQEKRVYTEKLSSTKGDFSMAIEIPEKGKYKIGIFYGIKGVPSLRTFSVVQQQIESKIIKNQGIESDVGPYKLGFKVVDNNLILNLSPLVKAKTQVSLSDSFVVFMLKFYQQFDDQVVLVCSNLVQSQYNFTIPYYKFANFYETLTYLQVYFGLSKTLSALNLINQFQLISNHSFFATYHQFNEFKPEVLQLNTFPSYHLDSRGQYMIIKGVVKQQIRNQIVVLQPPKTFKQYSINIELKDTDKILINSSLNVQIFFDKEGTYIIQINHVDGYAALNQPIYVGSEIYPLLPDFQDLKPFKTDKKTNLDQTIDQIKNQILQLINQKRAQFGQRPLYLDSLLGNVAQKHADDMLRRNYISHTSPEGLGPVERAKSGGIFQQVSQNIALNSGIQEAHYRLCRSNIHLRNMVRPYWQRLGLGITKNSQGAYIIVQEYSTRNLKANPLTQIQLNSIKSQIIKALIENSTSVKSQNATLSADVLAYAKLKSSGTSSQYATLGDYLRATKRYKKWSFSNLKVTYKSEGLVNIIKSQPTIMPKSNSYTQIGMSVEYSEGFLIMLFAFV